MEEQTGSTYKSASFAKALFTAGSKEYKTASLMAWSLGLFPWQKNGGVVDRPENLHVITFDSGALSGVNLFLKKTLGASDAALNYRVWNFQKDAREVYATTKPYNHSLFTSIMELGEKLTKMYTKNGDGETPTGEMPVFIFSSLTVLAMALERALMGAPTGSGGSGKGVGDEDRWSILKRQLYTIQNMFQRDFWHMFWEAHIAKLTDDSPETLQVSGSAGRNWGMNMEQMFRIQRRERVPGANGSTLERMVLNTQAPVGLPAGGRNFNELLNPEEPDLTVALYKLGLRVGQWNKPAKKEGT